MIGEYLERFTAHAHALRGEKLDVTVARKLAERWIDRLSNPDRAHDGLTLNRAHFDLKWLDDYTARRATRFAA